MKKTLIHALVCFIVPCIFPATVNAQFISTIAGCGIGDDSLATKAELVSPVAVTFDASGNTYIADAGNYRVRKINTAGVITTFAGNGVFGYSGDGGPAALANIGQIYGVAADKEGDVYIVDYDNSCIRKINTAGIISTIAGTGTPGYNGDSIAATSAQLYYPIDVIVDGSDNVIFTDWQNYRVRKINTAGIITTIVGDGKTGTTGNHGPATAAELGSPFRVTMDNDGNLYVSEVNFQCICKVDTAGILTIIADTTGTYAKGTDGDGSSAFSATMTSPCGLAVDTSGNLYFSDIGNNRIRKIDLNTGIISNCAGNDTMGCRGDGGAATAAEIAVPEGLACDAMGNLYISDANNNRVREVSTAGVMSTFAGQSGLFDENYSAINSEMCIPENLATDGAGNVYFADVENNRVRKINVSTGLMTTVAGSGIGDGFSGDGGPATLANIDYPVGVAVDDSGNIYVADEGDERIRKINTLGIISTFAGDGYYGYSGDDYPAISAKLNSPTGVAVDGAGNVYIADEANSRIRKVNTAGIITTVAGSTVGGYSGDGGPATAAELYYPVDIAVDGSGNLYISDYGNNTIRKVNTDGIISSLTLIGAAGFSGDGDSSIYAQVSYPQGLKVDKVGNLFFADMGNQRIRVINAYGIINTVAGNGTPGFSGDGGLAKAAMLNRPTGIAVDRFNNMYIADGNNFRIRNVNVSYLSVPGMQAALDNILVYPNPAHDKVTVEMASHLSGGEYITLYNAIGQEIYNMPFLLNKQNVNISSLSCGIYILEVTNGNGEKKIVKVTKE